MSSKTKAEEIYAIISSIIGKKAWEVRKGFGTVAFLEFGELTRSRFGRVVSDRTLWLEDAWRIETSDEVLTSSYTYVGDPHYKEVLKLLEGKTLIEVTIKEPSLDTTFHFEDDLSIFVYNSVFIDDEYENKAWHFVYPVDNILMIGPGPNYSIESYTGR